MLELTKRASVNEHFLTLAFHIYEQWMENEEKNARTYPAGAEVYKDRNAMRHARIINLLHGGDGDGRSGKQYEVTKLRVLPFTEFSAISHGGTPYLVGQTKPIVINVGENSRRIPEGDYHLGAYRIYIPPSVILKGNIDYIHMVPVKDSLYREPLHAPPCLRRRRALSGLPDQHLLGQLRNNHQAPRG